MPCDVRKECRHNLQCPGQAAGGVCAGVSPAYVAGCGPAACAMPPPRHAAAARGTRATCGRCERRCCWRSGHLPRCCAPFSSEATRHGATAAAAAQLAAARVAAGPIKLCGAWIYALRACAAPRRRLSGFHQLTSSIATLCGKRWEGEKRWRDSCGRARRGLTSLPRRLPCRRCVCVRWWPCCLSACTARGHAAPTWATRSPTA